MGRLPRSLKRSRKQEKDTAKTLGGRVQPGSGNLRNPFLKEDTISDECLCQCKTTEKASYSIKRKEFDETEERALRQMKMPVWRITLQDETDLAVIRYQDLLQLMSDAGMR